MKSGWVAESTWSDGRRGTEYKNSLISMTGRRGLTWQDNRVRFELGWAAAGWDDEGTTRLWTGTLNYLRRLLLLFFMSTIHFDNWYKRTAGIRAVKYWLCSIFFSFSRLSWCPDARLFRRGTWTTASCRTSPGTNKSSDIPFRSRFAQFTLKPFLDTNAGNSIRNVQSLSVRMNGRKKKGNKWPLWSSKDDV